MSPSAVLTALPRAGSGSDAGPAATRRPSPQAQRIPADDRVERIGILGGTFDPPHVGHLWLASLAADSLDLARVLFMPAAQPPHKRRRGMSSITDRLLMTRLAITVCVANEDDRGQQSLEVIYDIRAQLLRALVGWQPGPQFGPLMYVGMPDEPAINRARVWLQFDFQGLDFTASAV